VVSDRDRDLYLSKAWDSLAGAESECAAGRFDNCANRLSYACFQAAVAALLGARIGPPNQAAQWGHEFVQVRFVGDLVNRRKRYPAALRETLIKGLRLRLTADYKTERVKATQAMRGLARAEEFVTAIGDTLEERP